MKKNTIILIAFTTFLACNSKEKKNPVVNPPTYNPNTGEMNLGKTNRDISIPVNKRITWEFTLPLRYNEMTASEVNNLDRKGREAIERLSGQSTDDVNRTVFAAKSDNQNMILVTKGPYDPLEHGMAFTYLQDIENVTMQTYTANGMPFNFKRSNIDIDGLNFRKLDITLFRDNSKTEVVLYQTLFSRIMENTLLVITHSYNQQFAGITAQKSITASTFR